MTIVPAIRFGFGVLAALALLGARGGQDARNSGWYQFRGPNRDGLSPDTGLLKQWPSGGPPLAWKASGLGTGYSAVSFGEDRLYTMGDVGGRGKLHALNPSDGKILWSADVGEPGGNRGPGPRSTPATDGKNVFALGQHGDLVCAEAASGKALWRKSLVRDFGGRAPRWFYSESPLLDGEHVLCTPGGSKGTVVALKKATGETVWQSREFTDSAHYTSLVPIELGGLRQYVVLTDGNVAGLAAKDGKLLWKAKRVGKTAVVDTPIYRDGMVFVSSGYGVGCNAFKVTAAEGGAFKAEEVYSGKQIQSHHGGMILVGDHVYGLGDGQLRCVELKTGKVAWENRCVGKGAIAYADGHLVCRSERGPIALVEATPSGYKEKGRFDQPDRSREADAQWPHPIVFGGKLYIRDWDLLLCYDVKAK